MSDGVVYMQGLDRDLPRIGVGERESRSDRRERQPHGRSRITLRAVRARCRRAIVVVPNLLLLGVSTAHAEEFAFDGVRELAAAYRPAAIELTDLDADGDLDLVVVNKGEIPDDQWFGSGVQVWKNAHLGVFEGPRTYSVPNAPSDLAVCDLNGDGRPDLATANAAPDNLSVLLNDGQGDFVAGAIIAVGVDPVVLVCRDFDRDGDMDLASADQFAPGVAVAFNNGDATFGPAMRYPLGDLVNSLEAGDVDNDGDHDVIAVTNSSAFLFRNDGLGILGTPVSLELSGALGRPTLCRVDSDANLDLVTPAMVFFGSGLGSFGPAGVSTGLNGTRARCHDFDGNGTVDIIAASGIALSAGPRVFGPRIDMFATAVQTDVAVGDFDGDGFPDVARLHAGAAGPIGFATLIPGRGTSVPTPRRFAAGGSVWGVTAVSMGPDPNPDLAVINVGTGPSFLNGAVSLLSGLGDGTYSPQIAYAAGARVRAGGVAELDGDLLPDVVALNSNAGTVSVLSNDGGGGLDPPVSHTAGESPEALAVGDFDGDGDTDIAVANSTSPGRVSVLMGDGAGGLAAPVGYTVTCDRPTGIVATRIVPGAYPDLAVVCSGRPVSGAWVNAGMSVLRNNWDGTFAAAAPYPTSYLPAAVDACDFDRDGDVDLVAGLLAPPGSVLLAARIQVFLNDGSGAFPSSVLTDLTNDHSVVRCGDLNGDGYADVVVPYRAGSVVSILPGRGDGSFAAAEHFAVGTEPRGVVLADLNGDALVDLAVASGGSNDVTVILNRGPLPSRLTFLGDRVTLSWPSVPTAVRYSVYRGNVSDLDDVDRDGLPDAGYGSCQNHRDTTAGGLFDTSFQDLETPAAGDGFFYLVTFDGLDGENGLGHTSSRLLRLASVPCP